MMIQQKYQTLSAEFDERSRRMWAATEAQALGYGGITLVAQATGLAVSTIRLGQQELRQPKRQGEESWRRVRNLGGGRKAISDVRPEVVQALEALVESTTRGDPMAPLRWTCKSTRNLAEELNRQGHAVSHMSVARMLATLNYSLQAPRKMIEGLAHPDRNAQFEYINREAERFQRQGQPVISVDTKKKELVGNFANKGTEYYRQGTAPRVRVHDFIEKELGKAIPYGVYDLAENSGWVSVGTDHDTAEFAVQTIQRWWTHMGRRVYPQAKRLLITADGGGSNGSRNRLWKVELQCLANRSGLEITVCHFPPGTSKWNKIEHRMFSHITENWRGRPLLSREVIVNLIANTTTRTGLRIRAKLDESAYPSGIKISKEKMETVNLIPASFHGDWNYKIKPV